MNDILRSYIEDLRDSLMLFNEALMMLDQGSTDDETINRVFRVAHTIKGNSAAMEFYKVEKVMHTMEDILSEVREGEREMTDDIGEVLYECHDFLEDFLEVVLATESDETVKSEDLLKELVKIKSGGEPQKQEEAVEKTETKELSFLDEAFNNVEEELLDVVQKNVEMGLSAYQIIINFKPDVQMKSIRAFMLFQKIESNSQIIYSNPVAPTEEEFSNGEFECTCDALKILVIADSEMENIIAEISDDFTVENVDSTQLTSEQIKDKIESVGAKGEIIEMIKSIEVDVLDVQKSEINNETVNLIIQNLNEIIKKSSSIENSELESICLKLIAALTVISEEKKSFPPEDMQVVALVLQDMTSIAEGDGADEAALLRNIEENMKVLEEYISEPDVKIGEILKSKGILSDNDIEDIILKQNDSPKKLKFGQMAVKEKKVSAVEMTEVLKEQQKKAKPQAASAASSSSADSSRQIRVSENKVDNLLDMLGELTILNSQLEQQLDLESNANAEILNTVNRTSKIIRSVQDLSMSLRLIQIKNTLFRLTRIIRDTAHELDKKVNIAITGDEIEIDRSAAEKIFDPLMHLVRNAVSHGIESAEERIAAGKHPEGRVEINAYSKRGNVYIEVKDDGKGIDPDKVLAKAISIGMADKNTDYTDAEIIRFIMEPGFSTQVEVNNISGRGVGMNVVESEIMKIGGKVEIESEKGKGSTFIIRIPMNLALVNGTIVELSGEQYIIPTLFIKQFYIKEENEWISMQGKKRAIKIRENIIPIITEEAIFDRKKQNELERKQIIILEMDKTLLGLPVDNIVGRQEIVSKPLDSELAKARVLAGASILGDGKVSLILDVEALYKLAGY